MAHTVDSISIRGLRKAHLRQLATYIRERDREGWYYGPREQFERRHADLLKLADRIEAIADDEDARLPNIPRPTVPGKLQKRNKKNNETIHNDKNSPSAANDAAGV